MKKFISILFSSLIPTGALSCLLFNVIETTETRFDSQGIYIFSVLCLSFAIGFSISALVYRICELKEDIDNLRKEINKQNTNH
jgi:hypothetical protein